MTTTPHVPATPDINTIMLAGLIFATLGMVLAVAAKVVEIDRRVRAVSEFRALTEDEWVARREAMVTELTERVAVRLVDTLDWRPSASQGGAVLVEAPPAE